MTNIFNFLVLSNTLLILLFQPCSCACKRDNSVVYLKEDLKDYTLFQASSFWIYQKQPSGLIDTVTLITSKRENIQNEYCQPSFETFSGIKYSSISGDSIYISSDYVNNFHSLSAMKSLYSQTVFFSGNLNDSISQIPGSLNYTTFLPSYSQSNTIFSEVRIFTKAPFINNMADSVVKVFWAKGVGLIRTEYANGGYDELVKFQVKQ